MPERVGTEADRPRSNNGPAGSPHPRSKVSAVVLAAGSSSRMGRSKMLVPLNGVPMLTRVLTGLQRSAVAEVVVVLGSEAERVRAKVPLDGVRVVVNPEYAEGLSTSLRAGLRAANPGSEGFLIVLADQPFVSPSTIDALIRHHAANAAKIVIPTYRGVRGNPVLLDRDVVPTAMRIRGDQGARALFQSHADEILEVPVNDQGIVTDLDTKDDLANAASLRT